MPADPLDVRAAIWEILDGMVERWRTNPSMFRLKELLMPHEWRVRSASVSVFQSSALNRCSMPAD